MRRVPIKEKGKSRNFSYYASRISKHRLSLFGVAAIVVGLVIVSISATMHPIYLNPLVQTANVNVNGNIQGGGHLEFGAYPNVSTNISFEIPSGTSLHYVLYNVQAIQIAPHDFVDKYIFASQGNISQTGQYVVIPASPPNQFNNYQVNVSTSLSSFQGKITATSLIPTHAATNVNVEIVGLAIFASGLIATVLWLTFILSKKDIPATGKD